MLKNFLTLGAGEILARGLHAIAFLFLARRAGKEALGIFGFAATVNTYVLIAVIQGFDTPATRETSRDPSKILEYVQRIIGLRLFLAVFGLAGMWSCVTLFHPEHPLGLMLTILSLSYVTNSISPKWAFIAQETTRPLAIASLVQECFFFAGALLIQSPSQVYWIAAAQLTGEFVHAGFLMFKLSSRIGLFRPILDWKFSWWIIRESAPITMGVFLASMMGNFDVMALKAMTNDSAVGLYLAAFRCTTVFGPLISAVSAVVLPRFSRGYPEPTSMRRNAVYYGSLAFAGLSAAALALSLFPALVLRLLYGVGYQDGAYILRVVVWVLPLQGMRAVLRPLLFAFHLQRLDLRNMAFGVVTNAVLDIILIPHFGPAGCAISSVVSELVLVAACLLVIRRRFSAPQPIQ